MILFGLVQFVVGLVFAVPLALSLPVEERAGAATGYVHLYNTRNNVTFHGLNSGNLYNFYWTGNNTPPANQIYTFTPDASTCGAYTVSTASGACAWVPLVTFDWPAEKKAEYLRCPKPPSGASRPAVVSLDPANSAGERTIVTDKAGVQEWIGDGRVVPTDTFFIVNVAGGADRWFVTP